MPVRKIKKALTLGDLGRGIGSRISGIKTAQLSYILLLIATFLIGYLLARVQILEGGSSTTVAAAGTQQQQAPAAGEPAPPDPKDVLSKVGDAHLPIKGDKNAKVSIVEFSDFECPFCARFYSETMADLVKEYVDTGKASLDYRHYPLPFHPQAKPLAIASECANDQGKFWEMHDMIFEKNTAGALSSATKDTYKEWAADLGLDADKFATCLDNDTFADVVEKDNTLGSQIGVSGTPTFYINGRQLVGAQPLSAFKAIIDEELKK